MDFLDGVFGSGKKKPNRSVQIKALSCEEIKLFDADGDGVDDQVYLVCTNVLTKGYGAARIVRLCACLSRELACLSPLTFVHDGCCDRIHLDSQSSKRGFSCI